MPHLSYPILVSSVSSVVTLNLIAVNVASAQHVSISLQVQQVATPRRDSSAITHRQSIRKRDAIIVGKRDMRPNR